MNKRFAARLAAATGGVAASTAALAVDPATGLAAVAEVAAGATGYGPPMFGLAVISVGIMIAVKWIKRSRGVA
jgi:hypothetical protein